MLIDKKLDALKEALDDIEEQSEKDHRFIEDVLIRREEKRLRSLSQAQMDWIDDCYKKYCDGDS